MKLEQNALMMFMLTEESLRAIINSELEPLKQNIQKLEGLLTESDEQNPLVDYVSTKVAAEMLKVKETTIRKYQNEGKLKTYREENRKGHVFSKVEVLRLAKRL